MPFADWYHDYVPADDVDNDTTTAMFNVDGDCNGGDDDDDDGNCNWQWWQ